MVGDDVARGAGLAAADGQHCSLGGRDLAGYDGLQPDDDHGGEHHGIDGVLRHGTVAATAVHGDLDAVSGRQKGPGTCPHRAGDAPEDMLGQGNVRGGDAREQAVVDHCLGAVAGLLGGLEQREQGAVPLAGVIGHELGHAKQAGHMDVVAAGVGHRYLVAVGVLGGRGARVIRAGVLFDRQCVHVSPEQHGGPVSVGQHADHAGAADAGLDRAAILLQLPGDALCGALFLVGQLGVLVQIFVESLLGGLEAVVAGQDLLDAAHGHRPLRWGA